MPFASRIPRSGRRKITTGFVIQTYSDDGKCIEQEFIAGDVEWEDENGEPISAPGNEEYQPFEMVQPDNMGISSNIPPTTIPVVGTLKEDGQKDK